VIPPRLILPIGDSARLRADVRDSRGNPVTDPPTRWQTSNANVASVDSGGLVVGRGSGQARIVVTSQATSGNASVEVAPAILVGAADIADCSSIGDEATSALLDAIAGTVFTAGDNAYENGTLQQFEECYGPSWGRHRTRTRPAPGNHDYLTPGAAAYFAYFGDAAGDPSKGYYSYDLATWHIVVLNTNVDVSAGSPQEQWVRADLAAHPAHCTLAYWHYPRFSSGLGGNHPEMQPMWQALYDAGAEVVISGHDHDYERFAPQTPSGAPDSADGIREFVVGTGGKSLLDFHNVAPNSRVRNNSTFGVLLLKLYDERYEWEFVPTQQGGFTDAGGGTCH
jgi:hypothetical protein